MTPEEKASKLIEKFRTEIYRGVITHADFNPKREAQRNDVARRVAIICVDELTENMPTAYSLRAETDYDSPDCQEYWIKVREELLKLK